MRTRSKRLIAATSVLAVLALNVGVNQSRVTPALAVATRRLAPAKPRPRALVQSALRLLGSTTGVRVAFGSVRLEGRVGQGHPLRVFFRSYGRGISESSPVYKSRESDVFDFGNGRRVRVREVAVGRRLATRRGNSHWSCRRAKESIIPYELSRPMWSRVSLSAPRNTRGIMAWHVHLAGSERVRVVVGNGHGRETTWPVVADMDIAFANHLLIRASWSVRSSFARTVVRDVGWIHFADYGMRTSIHLPADCG